MDANKEKKDFSDLSQVTMMIIMTLFTLVGKGKKVNLKMKKILKDWDPHPIIIQY